MKKPDWQIWLENKEECKTWLVGYIKKGMLVKSAEESVFYVKKTNHNLNFANWIFDRHKDIIKEFFGNEKFYDWAINIYYYAVYHSALALISKKGYNSKSHYATLCFLIYYFYHLSKQLEKDDVEVVANSLSKEDIEIIGFSKELRERASYNVHESFEEKLADNARRQAVSFVNKLKMILELGN